MADYPTRSKAKPRRTDTHLYSDIEKREIEKYRSLIHRIKKDNELLHKEITHLYGSKNHSTIVLMQIILTPPPKQ